MENENHSETRHVAHLMPCRIKYDGECSDAFTEKSFRGRRLFSTPAPESMKPLLITREGDDTEWKIESENVDVVFLERRQCHSQPQVSRWVDDWKRVSAALHGTSDQ